jgi:putative transposase
MARPLRLDYCGAVWHITARGNERRDIVRDDHDRRTFVELLGRCVQKYAWILHTWTLMDNHYHLVVEVPEANISRGMQWLNGCYAQRFNRRHGRVGHLFQGRFKGILLDSDEYLLRLCRYVVLNPVRAGMVSRPEEWPWSSYRAIAGLDPTPNWLTTSTLLSRIAPDPEEARMFYRAWVTDGLSEPSPLREVQNQVFLGMRPFLQKMRTLVEERTISVDHPAIQRAVGRPALSDVVRVVAQQACAASLETPRQKRLALLLSSYLGVHEALRPLHEVASVLGLRSAGYVSTLSRRCELALPKDREVRVLVRACVEELRSNARG